MIESIKITSLNDIGANLSYTSVFPVVDINGTPITDKANLQLIGNYILSQAGGSNMVQAAQATLAQSVVNAAQPNITSVGTLTSLTLSGNLNIAVSDLNLSGGENGYVLQTDGEGNLSWTAQTGNGGGNGTPGGSNTQVQFNDAGNFGGNSGFTFNKAAGALASPKIDTAEIYHLGGVVVENADLTHGATAAVILPSNGNASNPVQVTNTYGNVVLTTGINSGSLKNWTFDNTGNLTLPSNTFAVNYANGTTVPLGEVQSKIANGISNVNIATSGGAVTVQAGSAGAWTFGTDSTLTAPNGSQILPAGNNFNILTAGTNGSIQFFTDSGVTDHNWLFDGYGFTSLPNTYGYTNTAVITQQVAGNIIISAGYGPTREYKFGDDGNLTLPLGSYIRTDFGGAEGRVELTSGNAVDSYASLASYDGNNYMWVDANGAYVGTDWTGNAKTWTFGADGNLSLPSNTSSINYANGQPYGGGGGLSNKIVNGNSYANIADADGNLVININNNLWTFNPYGVLEIPGYIANPVNYNQLDLFSNAVVLSSEGHSVSIVADNANSYQVWTFGADGNLTFPGGSLTIGNLAGAPTIQSAANLNLQLLSSGDGGVADIVWFDDVNSPSKVAAVVVNNPLYVGDADVGIVTGDILGGGGNTYIWNFGADGTLALPIQGNIVGLTPDNSGYMQWVGNSSGDGSGYTTLRLIPDETLVAGDQYLIIDPTVGGHIHIRAGGTQDNSYGQLYLGAEQNFVRVIDNQGLTLQNQLVTQTTNNYADPADFAEGTWFSEGGSYYIQYTSTNAQLDVDPYQDINIIFISWNSGVDYATLTYAGASQNLGGGTYKVSVNEAPLADPTGFDTLAYTLNITNTNTVTLDSDGFNVGSQNDVTLIGNGYVELTNTSNTEGVLIRTDAFGNAHNWLFNSLGQTVFPTLTVDLHNGGNQSAQTLQFGDPDVQAVITGPTPALNNNAQRLIIQGQRGTGGEGGDVYLWGGDSDVNGGDIKIYAGDADVSGSGGYINIDGGSGVGSGGALNLTGGQSSGGPGGQISITPGYSGGTDGAPLNLNGGQAVGNGGNVNITAGYGQANGGAVIIGGGQSALGLPGYGNVYINAGASQWAFDNTGNLSITNNINNANVITANYFVGDGSNLSNISSSNIIGTVANASYADTAGTVAATGNINANGFYINNLATPMQSTDAATKAYVDDAASGLHIHDPVNAATVEDLATTTGGTVTYNNGVSGVGANLVISGGTLTTIDAVSLTTNMRVMVKDEANAAWNGVYVYNNNTTLTRATDFDDEVQASGGDYFFVDAGYVNGKTSWVQITANVVVGVDPMNFVQFSAAGSYNAGTGLTLSGSTFSVNASQTQITSVGTLSNLTVSGQITSTQATGTAPFAIASTTKVANLNVEQVDGYHADITNTANTLVVRDANGNVYSTSYFGDGSHLSNISAANVVGTAANANYSTYSGTASVANSVAVSNVSGIGNIATLNLDGNASNILYGNGSFAAVPVSYGNSNVATFLASYGSNTIVTTGNVQVGNIIGNGQALTGINGSNVTGTVTSATNASALLQNTSSSTTVYPTFTTSSANGNSSAVFNTSISANLANASITATTFVGTLSGAATSATTAGTVTTTAQPNITSVGTLSSLTVTGNITGGNLIGALANGNSNVNIPAANGNVNISAAGNANVVVVTGTGANISGTLNVTGNITGNTAGFAIGYRDIPQISFTGNATIAATDGGKHYYSTLSTANTLTISNSATTNFAIGTAINIINQGTANINVNAASGVTLYLAGNSTAGNRVVTSFGMATIQKVATDTWFIVGAGVQ